MSLIIKEKTIKEIHDNEKSKSYLSSFSTPCEIQSTHLKSAKVMSVVHVSGHYTGCIQFLLS